MKPMEIIQNYGFDHVVNNRAPLSVVRDYACKKCGLLTALLTVFRLEHNRILPWWINF